jgi:hypothetical protein
VIDLIFLFRRSELEDLALAAPIAVDGHSLEAFPGVPIDVSDVARG